MGVSNLLIMLLLVRQIADVYSLVDGAPIENCRSMIPQHGDHSPTHRAMPQMEPPPYTFEASLAYNNGSRSIFNVTISSPNQEPFKGYFIQARSQIDDAIIGKFELEKGDKLSKVVSCPGGTKNAVTHNLNTKKRFVSCTWKPPVEFQGKFYFIATIVAEFKTFWLAVQTPSFNITK